MSALQAWAPPVLAGIIRIVGQTWRIQRSGPAEHLPHRRDRSQRLVYSLWHRTILANSFLFRDLGVCGGVSEHADGELGARTAERLGFETARGSSTRGSTRLVREMLRFAKHQTGDLALTPDGPKGPAGQAKPGTVFLAARLGWPLLPTGTGAWPCKNLNSWDRFLIPLPFARVVTVFGDPIHLQGSLTEDEVQYWCQELDRRMAAAESEAERLARGTG